jgi:hypothetical protein
MMRLQPIVARGASLNFCLIVTLDWRHGGSPMGFGLQRYLTIDIYWFQVLAIIKHIMIISN